MQTKILFSFSIFLTFITQAYTQTNMTLDDAIEIALKNNHNLKLVKYNKQQADSKVREAFGNALPSLNFSSNYTRALDRQDLYFGDPETLADGPFGLPAKLAVSMNELHKADPNYTPFQFAAAGNDDVIEIGSDNAFNTRFELTQTLFDYSVFTGIGSSKRYSMAASEALSDEELNTIKNVKISYFTVLMAKESVGLIKSSIKNAQTNLNDIKLMFKEGLISEYDLIRTEVQVENLQPELLNAESQLNSSLNNLNLIIGNKQEDKISVSQNFTDLNISMLIPNIEESKKNINNNNNQLKSLDLQMQVQKDFIVLYQSEFFPRLSLFGNYTYLGNANDTKNYVTYTSSEVGVRMSLNLFNGMQSSERIEQAEIDYMKVETQKSMLKSSLMNQAENIINRMETAKRKIESTNKTVSQAKRGYDIAKTRYDEGIGSLLEINDADLAFRQSKLNKIRADYDFLTAEAELEKLSGKK